MRRRRLALRQIAEATQHVSDIDDGGDSERENGSGDREDKPPTFSLLTVTTAPGGAGRDAAIELSDSDDNDSSAANNASSSSEKKTTQQPPRDAGAQAAHGAAQLPISNTSEQQASSESTRKATDSSSSIFRLYQEGLAPDQVLQLAFTRRRTPRATRRSPGDAFALQGPSLSVHELLAPTQDLTLASLFPADAGRDTAPIDCGPRARATAIASAKQYLHCPDSATFTVRQSWHALSERDWHDMYDALGTAKGPSAEPSHLTAAAVNALLRDVASDALAQFVWDALLPVVLALESPDEHELLTRLVQHRSFRSLAPAAFRAKVRAMELQARMRDAPRGAMVERQLLALYHRTRLQSQQASQSSP